MTKNWQINALLDLDVNYIGINFYKNSPRFFDGKLELTQQCDKLVGVFVNEELNTIITKIYQFELAMIQLHGDESPEFCKKISHYCKVMKAIPDSSIQNKALINEFSESCEMLLIDSAYKQYGGSGKKFDWKRLTSFQCPLPFILAGGISRGDVSELLELFQNPSFLGVDINSKFENGPGDKNIDDIQAFVNVLRNEISIYGN